MKTIGTSFFVLISLSAFSAHAMDQFKSSATDVSKVVKDPAIVAELTRITAAFHVPGAQPACFGTRIPTPHSSHRVPTPRSTVRTPDKKNHYVFGSSGAEDIRHGYYNGEFPGLIW